MSDLPLHNRTWREVILNSPYQFKYNTLLGCMKVRVARSEWSAVSVLSLPSQLSLACRRFAAILGRCVRFIMLRCLNIFMMYAPLVHQSQVQWKLHLLYIPTNGMLKGIRIRDR